MAGLFTGQNGQLVAAKEEVEQEEEQAIGQCLEEGENQGWRGMRGWRRELEGKLSRKEWSTAHNGRNEKQAARAVCRPYEPSSGTKSHKLWNGYLSSKVQWVKNASINGRILFCPTPVTLNTLYLNPGPLADTSKCWSQTLSPKVFTLDPWSIYNGASSPPLMWFMNIKISTATSTCY